MRHQLLSLSLILVLALSLSACHSMPQHAKYIPKDAGMVLSVDIAAMGKKMAWNAIVGSKIFDEWKARPQQKDAMKGIENAGIDFMNTMYLYTEKDERFGGGQRITGLVPLSDAAKFETFVKKNFPQVVIKEQGTRKEAMITENIYAGWNKDLLVMINANANNTPSINYADLDDSTALAPQPAGLDAGTLSAEMEKAFAVGKDNALTGNKHFMALQKEGHDISIWMNYEVIMSDYMQKGAGAMGGLSLSNSLWKDAAFTTGLDFNKGSIKSDMKYYMPDELKEIGREMGSTNVDKEMAESLPATNLDMAGAFHFSPKGIRSILEKTGVLGLANVGLASQNLTVDEVLNTFTGDMGFTMNDFSLTATSAPSDSATAYNASTDYKTNADYFFVIKINKKESLNKLIQMAITSELLESTGNNTYTMKNGGIESPVLVLGDKYAVISNKAANATAYLAGNKGTKLSGLAAQTLIGHPVGMFFDIQQMTKSVDPLMKNADIDAATLAEGKKLLENVALAGGEFKNGAFDTRLDINFTNKEENSLIQILNFAMHASDAQKKGATAFNSKMP